MHSIKPYALFPLLLLLATAAYPLQDKLVEGEHYRMMVPGGWDVRKEIGPGPEFSFNMTNWPSWNTDLAAGQVLPKTHNHQPVLASGFIVGVRATEVAEAIKMTNDRNQSLPDRKFEKNDPPETITLKSGEVATIMKTRSTRMSRKTQQTRYDLFVYSAKAGAVYNVAFLINYQDPTFELEAKTKLDEHVRMVYSTFELKS